MARTSETNELGLWVGEHLSAAALGLAAGGATPPAVCAHLESCAVCRQRSVIAHSRSLDGKDLYEALERAEAQQQLPREQRPPRPDPMLTSGFARRLEQLLRLLPLLRLFLNEGKHSLSHLGRLEVGVLLLNAILNRMEGGEGGATREQLIHEVSSALAWYESGFAFLPTTARERRRYIEELLDDLTNASAQGRPFSETYKGYHLPEPATAEAQYRLVVYREHDGELQYQLSEQGLDMVYRLYEVDHFLTIEIELLLLLRQIERGQFEKALGSLDRLNTACSIQSRRMDALLSRIRRDPLAVPPSEIESNDKEVRQQIAEERKLFSKLREAILVQSQRINDLFAAAPDRQRRNEQLGRIKRGIDQSFKIHQGLSSKNLDMRRRYLDALERHMALRSRYRTLKVEPELLEPLLALPPDDTRALHLVRLLLPVRRPLLLSPWHLPFARRAEAQEAQVIDEFPADLDGLGSAPALGAEFGLAEQKAVHTALLNALCAYGGAGALHELLQHPELVEAARAHAHALGIHVLFLHNTGTTELGAPGDPFTPLHRLARPQLHPDAQRGRLTVTSHAGRCLIGGFSLRNVYLTLEPSGQQGRTR